MLKVWARIVCEQPGALNEKFMTADFTCYCRILSDLDCNGPPLAVYCTMTDVSL